MRDDEDDSMAANPEPHASTGYAFDTTAPRSRRPRGNKAGRWEVVFVEGRDPDAPVHGGKQCKGCPAVVAILHSIAPGIRREFCGECQGRSHR